MFSLIPPVGEPIIARCLEDPVVWPEGWQATYLGSGTQALAFGLRALQPRYGNRREVILPAYTCPAVVSAIAFAGLRPVLVDLAENSPFPAERALIDAIGSDTVVVIVANFLGVAPPYPTLAAAAAARGVAVVYDCCQGWPDAEELAQWSGAAVSFGRGKPVSVTTGGAWLARTPRPDEKLLQPAVPADALPESSSSSMDWRIRVHNVALHPRVFWWLEKLPFLHVGATRYVRLPGLESMNAAATKLLPANVARATNTAVGEFQQEVALALRNGLAPAFRFPAHVQDTAARKPLLRIPLLAGNRTIRDDALKSLRRAGVAASALYRTALPGVAGLEALSHLAKSVPVADDFAGRLLTLPTLSGRSRKQWLHILNVLLTNRLTA